MCRLYKIFTFILIVVGIIFLVRYTDLWHHITIENIKENRCLLQQSIQDNYLFSVFAYILLYIFLTAIAFPAAIVLTIAGGFLFGTILGTVYTNIGATIGSSISFLIMRYFLGNFIQKRFGHTMKSFNREFKKYGYSYLLSIHFISVIPLSIVNIFASLANISFRTFFWTTSLGIIPGSLVYSFAGKQLGAIEQTKDLFSWKIILAFVGLAILSILPILIRRRQKNRENNKK